MLLELAIGDAYGMGFEYCDANLAHNTLQSYIKRSKKNQKKYIAKIGKYTDDTQMSLAIAELLVEGVEWTKENIAQKFVDVFKRDPILGYSGNFQSFLESIKDGKEFLEKIRPNSDKSGSAMRACPIGVLPSTNEVIYRATIQASLTHDTNDGVAAARASALSTHFFLHYHGKPKDLPAFIQDMVGNGVTYNWTKPYKGKVGSKGHMAVRAAITAVSRNNKLSDCLKDCIEFSGDVDTVATIAMAAASCSPNYKKDLPQVLIDTLRNDNFGRDYLVELDNSLMTLTKSKNGFSDLH